MTGWRKLGPMASLCLFLAIVGLSACDSTAVPIQTGVPVSGGGISTLPMSAAVPMPVAGISPVSRSFPVPTAQGSILDSEESAFLGLINIYRAKNGAPALKLSLALTYSSKWMSNDMATKNYFSHTDSLGRDPFTRMTQLGYNYNTDEGENIAAGNATATDTFSQWEASPEHNANMLDVNYLVIGIGRAYSASSTYGWYWTTDFGGYVDQLAE